LQLNLFSQEKKTRERKILVKDRIRI